jgi:uncharacterized protein YoxC
MTRTDPTLHLSRLVVTKGGSRVYDEEFRAGVNIIRSLGNSAGKSTVVDLIFYALGGDLTIWKDEAALCDAVYAELLVNGLPVTVKRDIPEHRQGRQPMSIYIGAFEDAAEAIDGWQKYPYQRYGDKESFTQVLFRLLNLPDIPGEAESNITMHQLLRLMYVDQLTPVDRLFRLDPNDSPLRRQAVGDLLCGIYDERIYPAQLQLRQKEKEFEAAESQLSGLFRLLGANSSNLRVKDIAQKYESVIAERTSLLSEMAELKSHRFDEEQVDPKSRGLVADLKETLDKVSKDIADLETALSQLVFSMEDAKALIRETEKTLAQLREGQTAEKVFGKIIFEFCPSCFTPVTQLHAEHICDLCKTEIGGSETGARYARMRNELELQLKESQKLQRLRVDEIEVAKPRLDKLRQLRERIASEYLSITRNYLTEADAKIETLTIRVGYLDRELVDLERQAQLAEKLESLMQAKELLNKQIRELKDNITFWKRSEESRKADAYRIIHQKTAAILAMDVQSEVEFADVKDVYFDFAEDRITINGKAGFSASSLTVIRNAFHMALLWAACLDRKFKYPRFVLMDNIEDKGMTEARSQNFQRRIVEISESLEVDHQIIFTTSMVDPALDASTLTVGDKYSYDHKSLNLGRRAGSLV